MNLQAPPGSPFILIAAADLVLALHIGGGLVGIASGMSTLVARKGGRAHRLLGNVFFDSMLIMSAIWRSSRRLSASRGTSPAACSPSTSR